MNTSILLILCILLSMFTPNFENGENITLTSPKTVVEAVYDNDVRINISGNGTAIFVLQEDTTFSPDSIELYVDGLYKRWEIVNIIYGSEASVLLPKSDTEYAVFTASIDNGRIVYSYPVSLYALDYGIEQPIDSRKPLQVPNIDTYLVGKSNIVLSIRGDVDTGEYILYKQGVDGEYYEEEIIQLTGYGAYAEKYFFNDISSYGNYYVVARRAFSGYFEYSAPMYFSIDADTIAEMAPSVQEDALKKPTIKISKKGGMAAVDAKCDGADEFVLRKKDDSGVYREVEVFAGSASTQFFVANSKDSYGSYQIIGRRRVLDTYEYSAPATFSLKKSSFGK